MPSYRFCRPDDIPLLVAAVEACWRPAVPGEPEMTVERFRDEMKRLDVWPSNSLLALAGEEPVAVLVGTKRPGEVLVTRLAVLAGHRRRGHGSHLLTSLSQKLSVLGPDRLIAEVPRALPGAEPFFAACGWRPEAVYVDWRRSVAGEAPAGPAVPDGLVSVVDAGELVAALPVPRPPAGPPPEAAEPAEEWWLAWARRRHTLAQRADQLRGAAVVSPERLEAWLLWRPLAAGGAEVWRLGAADPGERGEALAGLLLGDLLASRRREAKSAGGTPADIVLPHLVAGELSAALLAAHGFTPAAETARWATRATPP